MTFRQESSTHRPSSASSQVSLSSQLDVPDTHIASHQSMLFSHAFRLLARNFHHTHFSSPSHVKEVVSQEDSELCVSKRFVAPTVTGWICIKVTTVERMASILSGTATRKCHE